MNKISISPRLTSLDDDYALWTKEQAGLLRAGKRDLLDLKNLAEEIESLGNSEKRAIESRVHVLLIHLLKWQFQPAEQSFGWRGSIVEQRRRIAQLVKASPSLKTYPGLILADEYVSARLLAAGETGLAESAFPPTCPYSIEQVLNQDFWPQ